MKSLTPPGQPAFGGRRGCTLLCSLFSIICLAAAPQDTPDPLRGWRLPEKAEPWTVPPREWADTVIARPWEEYHRHRYRDLTEEDYREVAQELGVEVAALKAVVDIESGKTHQGFWAEGKPLINFDLSMYRRYARDHGVSLAKAQKRSPVIFARPNVRRYGSQQAAQQARLDAARAIDEPSALKGTFWGMFQIGGFNWKQCGARSVQDFVERMSRSERDQLELFAAFIKSHPKMLDAIRRKNWLAFATLFNGPRAKARGYHRRLAAAYAKHKKK